MSAERLKYLSARRRRRLMILLGQLLILVTIFGLWEIAAKNKWIDPFIFSQPSRIFTSFMAMASDFTIFRHVGVTLAETIAGFVLGTIIGTGVSVLLWWNDMLERILNPYLVVLNALPKTALAPIIIVWIGNNPKSIIAVALLTSVVVTILTVLSGFLQVEPEKVKLIVTLGGTKKQALTKVILPASIPTIISALKINVGLSFVGVIVGEFLVAREGLGYLIVYGSQIFKMDWVMLSILILCLLAAGMYQFIAAIEKRFANWGR